MPSPPPVLVGAAARLIGALDRLSLLLAPAAPPPHWSTACMRPVLHRPLLHLRRVRRLGSDALLLFINDGATAYDLYLEAGGVLHELGRLRHGATASARVTDLAGGALRLHYRDADGHATCDVFALRSSDDAPAA